MISRSARRPGVVLALALVTVFAGACAPTEIPPSASTSAGASRSPDANRPCTRADVRVTSSGWGAAAGSRGSDVTVENAAASSCRLPAAPVVGLFDPAGRVLLQSAAAGAGAGPLLAPGDRAQFSFTVSNWCDEGVALPLEPAVLLIGEAAAIEGLPIAALSDLPGCMGPEQRAALNAGAWATD